MKAMKEQIKLLTASSIYINRVASLLDQDNISYLIKDNVESARLAGFGTTQNDVDLYVFESDIDRAAKIMEDFEKA